MTSRPALRLWLPLVLAACGGTPSTTTTPGAGAGAGGAGGTGTKPSVAGDDSFALPVVDVKGVFFGPEALGRPGMPTFAAKKKGVTVESQRKTVAGTKDPVARQAQAAVLASMLYDQSKTATGDAQKALLTEARQVLRDAATAAGKNIDAITLRLLGSYEVQLEDWAAAEKAWAGLVAATPKDKETPFNRAWWAFSLLMQNKNSEALEVVKNETLVETQPELAYVTAWAKWRASDDAGAMNALVIATKAWDGAREPLERDVFLFASRSNVSFTDVTPQLYGVFHAKQAGQQYDVLAKLGLTAYEYAGRWADGIAAIEKAFALPGVSIPPELVPVMRFKEADFSTRMDDPATTAKYAKQALDALPTCGAKCSDQDKQNIVLSVAGIGRLFHFQYATAHDIRYYQPANDIYIQAIPLITDQARRTETNKDAGALQATLKNTKVNTGRHDKDAVKLVVGGHTQEVQACYEGVLVGNPKLGGQVTATFEIEASGAVKGVSTEPAGGLADLAAVATCVGEHVKGWKFPKTDTTGTTRVTVPYKLVSRN